MANLLFTLLVLACCGYAVTAGGRDGRLVAAMFVIAGLASIPASMSREWVDTNVPVMAVDLMLLAGLYAVALKTRSFWPIWICGMHLASVSTHVASTLASRVDPVVYFTMQSFWSLPELGVMVAGIMLDRRSRVFAGNRPE